MKKKLLWICDDFSRNTGYSNMSLKLTEFLNINYNLKFLFINTDKKDVELKKNEYIVDVPPNFLKNYKITSIEEDFKDCILGCNKLTEVLEKENPDIVLSINDYQVVTKHLDIVKKYSERIKFICYVPVDCESFPNNFFNGIKKSDYIITMCNFSKDLIKNDIKRKIEVLPHFIEDEYEPSIISKKKLRKEFFGDLIPENCKIVLNVANSGNRKRLDIFMESLYILKTKEPSLNVIYVIKTDGSFDSQKYVNIYNEKYNMKLGKCFLKYTKNLNTHEMKNFYNSVDIFVSTSSGEGFGLTPFEAVSCETFTLVPDNTSYSEYFPKEMLIDCKMETYNKGRLIKEEPTDNLFLPIMEFIPTYKETEIKTIRINEKIELLNCEHYIINHQIDLETQISKCLEKRDIFQIVCCFDVKNLFEHLEQTFNYFKKLNIDKNKFKNWKIRKLPNEYFDIYLTKVKIPVIEDLVNKIINYLKNPDENNSILEEFSTEIKESLSLSKIKETTLSLDCFKI